MNIQMSDLTVTDPLVEQEVTVVVRVLPDNAERPARTVLVSVGTAGQPPVFVSGVLEVVADLIRQAWLAYGARADIQQRNAEVGAITDVETVAEVVVDDECGEDDTSPVAPMQPQSPVPTAQTRSRPQNLSLF